MKQNYNKLFLYAIVAALAILVLYSVFYKTEGFVDSEFLPRINQTQIAETKKGIKDFIAERPDLVDAAKQVLTDPDIAPTVHELLALESGNERQFGKACGCQSESECDCY